MVCQSNREHQVDKMAHETTTEDHPEVIMAKGTIEMVRNHTKTTTRTVIDGIIVARQSNINREIKMVHHREMDLVRVMGLGILVDLTRT